MSTSAAAAATNNNNDVAPDEVGSSNDRKRKAKEQGGRGDVEEKSKEISDDEEEERSIEQLVWEDLWSDDFETVKRATAKLDQLTSNDDDNSDDVEANRKRVVEASGHVIMLKNVEKSMGDKKRHKFIQANLGILMDLSYMSDKNREIVRKIPKVVDTIVKTAQAFADRSGCCRRACGVLGNLTVNDDDFKVKLFEAEVIALAVESMKRFANDNIMQRLGSHLLKQLLKSKKETKKMVDAANACKALTVLSEAKYNFPDEQRVKEYTTACIKILNEN